VETAAIPASCRDRYRDQPTMSWKLTGRLPGKATWPEASTILNRTKQKPAFFGAVISVRMSTRSPGLVSSMGISEMVWHWLRSCGTSRRCSEYPVQGTVPTFSSRLLIEARRMAGVTSDGPDRSAAAVEALRGLALRAHLAESRRFD